MVTCGFTPFHALYCKSICFKLYRHRMCKYCHYTTCVAFPALLSKSTVCLKYLQNTLMSSGIWSPVILNRILIKCTLYDLIFDFYQDMPVYNCYFHEPLKICCRYDHFDVLWTEPLLKARQNIF